MAKVRKTYLGINKYLTIFVTIWWASIIWQGRNDYEYWMKSLYYI